MVTFRRQYRPGLSGVLGVRVLSAMVAMCVLPLLYGLPPLEFVAASMLVAAVVVVPFLPRWRIPFLFAFCYIFPRNLEYHFGWRIPLMERQNGPSYLFSISIVPFDAVLLLTAAAYLTSRLLRGLPIRQKGGWWGGLFIALYAASILGGWITHAPPHDAELAALWSLFRGCLLWVVLMNAAEEDALRERMMAAFVVCGTLVAGAAVYRYLLSPVDAVAEKWDQRAASFGLGTGILGGLAMMVGLIGVSLFCFHSERRTRFLGLVAFAASFGAICYTFSRTPFALFVLLATWMLFRRSKLYVAVWIGVITLALFAALNATDLNGRLELIQSGSIMEESYRMTQYAVSAEMIRDHPFVGVGGFRYYDDAWLYLPSTVLRRLFHSHDLYLHVAAEAGIPALCAFLGLFGTLFLRARKLARVRDSLFAWRYGALYGFAGVMALHVVDYMFWDYRFLAALIACISIAQIPPMRTAASSGEPTGILEPPAGIREATHV